MTIKALSFDEMKTKLGDMVEGRPHLARYILCGQTSFSENGETFALRGSPALSRGEPDLVTRDVPADGIATRRRDGYDRARERSTPAESDRLVQEIRDEIAAEQRAGEPAPQPRVARAETPKPAAKVGHTKIAALLDGEAEPSALALGQRSVSRIDAHRADQAARSVGRIQGKVPGKLASLLDPKGAA